MNDTKEVIRISDLPETLQQKIREHQEEQKQLEIKKKFDEIMKEQSHSNIVINNNTYYITNNVRILRNEGIINEKDEPLLEQFARIAGRAAGKTAAWLKS